MLENLEAFKILDNIHHTEQFSERFADFIGNGVPYHNELKEETKSLYLMFFVGLSSVLGYDSKINFKQELDRPDVVLRMPQYNAIFQFEVSEFETDEILEKEAEEAVKKIDSKENWYLARVLPLPIYKIGIACHGKKCLVKTILHEKQ